jgi:hypothetical protein
MDSVESSPHGKTPVQHRLAIYVSEHCGNCRYAQGVAERIRTSYPGVTVQVIDINKAMEPVPDSVFATPTYLLDGSVWSLGNPSDDMIHNAFG